jgi:predicted porin
LNAISITLVALAAFAAVTSFAQTTNGADGFQITGNANAGYQMNSYRGISSNGFDQNGAGTSAINFRGQEDLGGGMKAYMRIENDLSFMNNAANTGVLPTYSNTAAYASTSNNTSNVARTTTGATSSWANGELAVGAKGSFGDLSFGALNNSGLNWFLVTAVPTQGTSFGGGYGTILGADPTMGSVRWANSTRYITPELIPGLQASFIYAAKQSNGNKAVSATGVASTATSLGVGLNNQVGAQEFGLKYATGPLTVAYVANKTSLPAFCAAPTNTYLANTSATVGTANNPCYVSSGSGLATGSVIDASQDNKQTGLSGGYAMGAWYFGGALQHTVLGGIGASGISVSDRQSYLLNAQYTQGVNTYFATYGSSKENAAGNLQNGYTTTMTAVGYNYAFSKNTSFVIRYEHLNDNANILGDTGANVAPSGTYAQAQGTNTANNTRNRSMIGLNYNF